MSADAVSSSKVTLGAYSLVNDVLQDKIRQGVPLSPAEAQLLTRLRTGLEGKEIFHTISQSVLTYASDYLKGVIVTNQTPQQKSPVSQNPQGYYVDAQGEILEDDEAQALLGIHSAKDFLRTKQNARLSQEQTATFAAIEQHAQKSQTLIQNQLPAILKTIQDHMQARSSRPAAAATTATTTASTTTTAATTTATTAASTTTTAAPAVDVAALLAASEAQHTKQTAALIATLEANSEAKHTKQTAALIATLEAKNQAAIRDALKQATSPLVPSRPRMSLGTKAGIIGAAVITIGSLALKGAAPYIAAASCAVLPHLGNGIAAYMGCK